MVNASSNLVATVAENGSSILLSVKYATKMALKGTSVPTGAPVTGEMIQSLHIYPEKDKNGIVVVSVWNNDSGKSGDWLTYTLPITWRQGKAFIDLEKGWIPSPDRRGQVTQFACYVTIRNELHSSRKEDRERGIPFLTDANAVCSYLVGDIGEEELLKTVVRGKTPLEVAQEDNGRLRLEVQLLEAELESKRQNNILLASEKQALEQEIAGMKAGTQS